MTNPTLRDRISAAVLAAWAAVCMATGVVAATTAEDRSVSVVSAGVSSSTGTLDAGGKVRWIAGRDVPASVTTAPSPAQARTKVRPEARATEAPTATAGDGPAPTAPAPSPSPPASTTTVVPSGGTETSPPAEPTAPLAPVVAPEVVRLPGGGRVELVVTTSMRGDVGVSATGYGFEHHWRVVRVAADVVELHSVVAAEAWRVTGRLDGDRIQATTEPIGYRPGPRTPNGQTVLPFSNVGSVTVCVDGQQLRLCGGQLQPGWHFGPFPVGSQPPRVLVVEDATGLSSTVVADFNDHGEAFARVLTT